MNLPLIGGNPVLRRRPIEQVARWMDLAVDFGGGPRLFRVTKDVERFDDTDDSGKQTTYFVLESYGSVIHLPAGTVMSQVAPEQPPPI